MWHLWGFKPCRQIPQFCSQNRKRLVSYSSTLPWNLLPESPASSFSVCVWRVHLCMKFVCMQINMERCMHTHMGNRWQPLMSTPVMHSTSSETRSHPDLALTNEATLDQSPLPTTPPPQCWCYMVHHMGSRVRTQVMLRTLGKHIFLHVVLILVSFTKWTTMSLSVKWGHPYYCALSMPLQSNKWGNVCHILSTVPRTQRSHQMLTILLHTFHFQFLPFFSVLWLCVTSLSKFSLLWVLAYIWNPTGPRM